MAQKAVIDAVTDRVTDNFTRCDVLAPNYSADAPMDGSPYLIIQFPVASVTRFPVNERYYREEGGFRLVLHVGRGSGHDEMMQWLGELADLFRDKKFDGVESKTPSSPLIDDENEEGGYFRSAIVVPYTFNFRD